MAYYSPVNTAIIKANFKHHIDEQLYYNNLNIGYLYLYIMQVKKN